MTDDNYCKELVQCAAVALAAAQVRLEGTTSLGADNEGVRGRFALERLLDAVRNERRVQELKWGTRTQRDVPPARWLALLLEKAGEVAEEIVVTVPSGINDLLVQAALHTGVQARKRLEEHRSGMQFIGNTPELDAEFNQALTETKRAA